MIIKIKKGAFLNWYFKYKARKRQLDELIIDKLKRTGMAQITARELLDGCDSIPEHITEGGDEFSGTPVSPKDCVLI